MDPRSIENGRVYKTMRQRLVEDSSEDTSISPDDGNGVHQVRDSSPPDPIASSTGIVPSTAVAPSTTLTRLSTVRYGVTSRRWASEVETSLSLLSSRTEGCSELSLEAESPVHEKNVVIDSPISPSDLQYQIRTPERKNDCSVSFSRGNGEDTSVLLSPEPRPTLRIDTSSPQNKIGDHKHSIDSRTEAKTSLRKKLSRYFSPSTPSTAGLPPPPSEKSSGQPETSSPVSPNTYQTPTKKKSFYFKSSPSESAGKKSTPSKKSFYNISSPIENTETSPFSAASPANFRRVRNPELEKKYIEAGVDPALVNGGLGSNISSPVENTETSPLSATNPTNFRRLRDPELEKKYIEAGVDPALINGGLGSDMANMKLVPLQKDQKAVPVPNDSSHLAVNAVLSDSRSAGDITLGQKDCNKIYSKRELLPDGFHEAQNEEDKSSVSYYQQMRHSGHFQQNPASQYLNGTNITASGLTLPGDIMSITGARHFTNEPKSIQPTTEGVVLPAGDHRGRDGSDMDMSRDMFWEGASEGGKSLVRHHQQTPRSGEDKEKVSFQTYSLASKNPVSDVPALMNTTMDAGDHAFYECKGFQQKSTAAGSTTSPAGSRGISNKKSSTNLSSKKGSSWLTELRGTTEPSQQALNQFMSQEFARAGVDPNDPDAAAKMKVSTRKLPAHAPSPTSKDPAITKKKKGAGFNESERSSPTSTPQRRTVHNMDVLSDSQYGQSGDSFARSAGSVLEQSSYNPPLSSKYSRGFSPGGSQTSPMQMQRSASGSPGYVVQSSYDSHEEFGGPTHMHRSREGFSSPGNIPVGQSDFSDRNLRHSSNRSARPDWINGSPTSTGQFSASSLISPLSSKNPYRNLVTDYSNDYAQHSSSPGSVASQYTDSTDRYAGGDFSSGNTGRHAFPGSSPGARFPGSNHRDGYNQLDSHSRINNVAPLNRHSEGHEVEKRYPLPSRAMSHGTSPGFQVDVEGNTRNFSYPAHTGGTESKIQSDAASNDVFIRRQPNRPAPLAPHQEIVHQEIVSQFPASATTDSQQIEANRYAPQGFNYEKNVAQGIEKEVAAGEEKGAGLKEEKPEGQDKPKKTSYLKLFRKK